MVCHMLDGHVHLCMSASHQSTSYNIKSVQHNIQYLIGDKKVVSEERHILQGTLIIATQLTGHTGVLKSDWLSSSLTLSPSHTKVISSSSGAVSSTMLM